MSYSVKTITKVAASVALVLALCFVLALGLVGCGDDDSTSTSKPATTVPSVTATTGGPAGIPAELVGKWYCERLKETIEFTADGKMIWTKRDGAPQTFTYTVQEGSIVFNQPNAPMENTLPFTLEGNSLTTVDPKYGRLTYAKQ